MKTLFTVFTLLTACLSVLQAQNPVLIQQKPLTAAETSLLNTQAQQRLPRAEACMEVKQPKVKLVLWDCGAEDNDTVSINLNGQWIINKLRLAHAKQEIEVTLAPGENQLTLFANNLGDIPDNTAAMAIKENGVEQQATLSSNLHTSGTMRLLVKGGPIEQAMTGCPEKQVFMDDENQQVRANPDIANPKFSYLYTGLKKYSYEPARTLEMQGCTNVSDSLVTLYFWDSGIEDNDTISVNVNGVWVVENMRLAKERQSIQVRLQPGSNYVVMYANNLGDIPNNTSGLGIEHRYGKQDLGTMYSDENTNGTFRFNCTAGSTPLQASQPCIKTNQNNRDNTDPEMERLRNAAVNNYYNYNNAQNPPDTYNSAVGAAIGLGVRIISTIPSGGSRPSGNTGGGNNGGSQPHQPSGNTPGGGRNPRPVNY